MKQKEVEFFEYHFELSNGTKFSVVSNLPKDFGLNIEDAFQNWLYRTSDFTAESFVEYVNSKNLEGYYTFTREAWNKLNSKV